MHPYSAPVSRPAVRCGVVSKLPSLVLTATLAAVALLPAAQAAPTLSAAKGALVEPKPARVVEDRIIIRLKPGKDASEFHRQVGGKARKLLRKMRSNQADLEVVDLPKGKREALLEAYRKSGLVEYAEPDYIMEALVEPNDFRFWDGSMWHLKNTGIYGGTVGADIDAAIGWDTQKTAPNVIVAVVDTGVRYTHEDLAANMWVNPGESGLDANGLDKRTNGIDDDGNTYIDDVHGINTLNHSGNPNDDFGHGTHVAGIIGAATNNSIGISGVAWQVQLMALKFLDYQGHGTISGAVECINYARAKGARIVNASWGSYAFTSQALRDAITNMNIDGMLFVAACGNSNANNDVNPLWPASYEYDNVIAVAATTRTDTRANFSNWGATTVDLAAPGSPIFSAWKNSNSDYRNLDGTSMAAPQVSGAAALIWARNPTLTHQQVVQKLISTTDPIPDFAGKTVSGGRLNIAAALAATPLPQPPSERTDITWVEDAIPIGAWTSASGGDSWSWITASPTPFSGTKAHQSANVVGPHDHTFQNATVTMPVAVGDILFLYVYLDPVNPPREIMVSWNNGNWEHRAYWGENLLNYGTNNTAARRYMGALPPTGQWVRLEVPASQVGLEGTTVKSMSFTLHTGRVTWDKIGRNTRTQQP